jgi:uncharacterized membrane protein YhaH (DUF805 family)
MNIQTHSESNQLQQNPPPQQQGGVTDEAIAIRFFSYDGRLGRLPYFLYGLLLNILTIPAAFVTLLGLVQLFGKAPVFPGGEFGMLSAVFVIVGIPYLIIALPLIVKRLHDFGKSGYLVIVFLLILFIPIVNLIAGFAMILIPGTSGANEYGPKTGFTFSKSQARSNN